MSPTPDERDRIRAAMERILRGTPEQSNGALTIVALALEAGVPRNALTQRHTDLRNEFYDKVRTRGGTPDSEQRLRKQVRRLKELRAADAKDISQLKADVESLVGALHQAATENHLLRRQQVQHPSVVRLLPTQPGMPPTSGGPSAK
ncbi:hypothetical protein EES37_36925 [Streptomyces sp. ADI91-18]|uniref:hypothetical protein n=1 Tax=Streptomyces sp. ADI91-18 TaxID=1522755 RepID=UPI000F558838|nr:hypothetical protein [Streptomyces sp. ADI91-18]RPK27505.1 hypothetical protein EES37_36925 [Streptomyces sp. ADI91-18]